MAIDGANLQKELFNEGGRSLANNRRLAMASLLIMEHALGRLQTYSLIHRIPDNDIAVQQVVLDYIESEVSMYFEAALKLVQAQFPGGDDLGNLGS